MNRLWLLIVGVALIVVGGLGEFTPVGEYAQQAWESVGSVWGTAKLTSAVIVEESADRPKLTADQIQALAAAPGLGVIVVDQNVLGKAKKPSPELQPYLDAAKDKPPPQLVRKWSSGKITSVDCPATLGLLKKAIGKP